MLSILIPVYNFSIEPLVVALAAQAEALSIDWEIRCYDDGSIPEWRSVNQPVALLPQVIYQELEQNIGRAAIRNLLAQDARFPYLLFLDNDSGIVRADFLRTYVQNLPTEGILYGGRVYTDDPPADPAWRLHWTYGHRRESLPLDRRVAAPYESFMTNNFCVPRTLMLEIGFDAQLTTYGHEDTIFGQELAQRGIPIVHLDNPVVHLGLEAAPVFLRKQAEALQNLTYLQQQYPAFRTRLLALEARLPASAWALLAKLAPALLPWLEKQLSGSQPRMSALDVWKLLQRARLRSRPAD